MLFQDAGEHSTFLSRNISMETFSLRIINVRLRMTHGMCSLQSVGYRINISSRWIACFEFVQNYVWIHIVILWCAFGVIVRVAPKYFLANKWFEKTVTIPTKWDGMRYSIGSKYPFRSFGIHFHNNNSNEISTEAWTILSCECLFSISFALSSLSSRALWIVCCWLNKCECI